MTTTLQKVQEQSSKGYYMAYVKTCTGDISGKFNSWFYQSKSFKIHR